jgi:hypothetical protein
MFPMAFDRETSASLPRPDDEHGKPVLKEPLDRTAQPC